MQKKYQGLSPCASHIRQNKPRWSNMSLCTAGCSLFAPKYQQVTPRTVVYCGRPPVCFVPVKFRWLCSVGTRWIARASLWPEMVQRKRLFFAHFPKRKGTASEFRSQGAPCSVLRVGGGGRCGARRARCPYMRFATQQHWRLAARSSI